MSVTNFLNQDEKVEIVNAIKHAEENTVGEIRIHIESKCKNSDTLKRAIKVFKKLKMHKTKSKSGVLIYIGIENHKVAIYGDSEIHKKATDSFWNESADIMKVLFTQNKNSEAILKGISMVKNKLEEYFPANKENNNSNELKDEISYE